MQKSPHLLILFLIFLGLSMTFNGIFVLGQSSLDSSTESGWRRTTLGWEHADSLPIAPKGSTEQRGLIFPTLTIPMDTIEHAHRLALPLALSGFMACLGPWLLIRWPTSDKTLIPLKNAES